MHEKIEFFLDGRPVTAASGHLSVHDLLRMADKPVDGDYVVTGEGIDYHDPDQSVEVHPGDKIEIRIKSDRLPATPHEVRYQVNGEDQITMENPLPAGEIMRRAGASAAIDVDDLDNYLLEHGHGTKYERITDSVTIREGDLFFATYRGATPVAWAP